MFSCENLKVNYIQKNEHWCRDRDIWWFKCSISFEFSRSKLKAWSYLWRTKRCMCLPLSSVLLLNSVFNSLVSSFFPLVSSLPFTVDLSTALGNAGALPVMSPPFCRWRNRDSERLTQLGKKPPVPEKAGFQSPKSFTYTPRLSPRCDFHPVNILLRRTKGCKLNCLGKYKTSHRSGFWQYVCLRQPLSPLSAVQPGGTSVAEMTHAFYLISGAFTDTVPSASIAAPQFPSWPTETLPSYSTWKAIPEKFSIAEIVIISYYSFPFSPQ